MTAPKQVKQPQDRKPKNRDDTPVGEGAARKAHMTVTLDGVTYTSTEAIADVVTFGMRRRWKDDPERLIIEVIEMLFADQPEAIAALDVLTLAQMETIEGEIFGGGEVVDGTTVGESGRFST